MSIRQQTVLERLRVKNYRSLADVDLSFDRLLVLLGPNGSGKSTVIDVLRFVRDALTRDLDTAITERGGIASIRRWSPRGMLDVSIQIWVRGVDWTGEYSFTIGSEARGAWRVKTEQLTMAQAPRVNELRQKLDPLVENLELAFRIKNGKLSTSSQGLRHLGEQLPKLISPKTLLLPQLRMLSYLSAPDDLYFFFTSTGFYDIFPDTLRAPQQQGSEYPLDEHGQNLASVLQSLQRQGERQETLNDALGRVVEGVESYNVRQVGGFLVTRLQHSATEGSRKGAAFDLSQESDGTLRMLGILTAVYQEPPRSLVTIEEPELMIHPSALGVLCDVLQEASARSQVVITTHSPDLIDRFPVEALRVVEKLDGVTSVGPVSSEQREIIARKLFSPGELLRIEGLERENAPAER